MFFCENSQEVLMHSISGIGACYGTAKAGIAISSMAVVKPSNVMKSLIPVIMAGVIAIYGLVIAVLISLQLKDAGKGYTLYEGFLHFGISQNCNI